MIGSIIFRITNYPCCFNKNDITLRASIWGYGHLKAKWLTSAGKLLNFTLIGILRKLRVHVRRLFEMRFQSLQSYFSNFIKTRCNFFSLAFIGKIEHRLLLYIQILLTYQLKILKKKCCSFLTLRSLSLLGRTCERMSERKIPTK